jgi:hypothetical protein
LDQRTHEDFPSPPCVVVWKSLDELSHVHPRRFIALDGFWSDHFANEYRTARKCLINAYRTMALNVRLSEYTFKWTLVLRGGTAGEDHALAALGHARRVSDRI